MGVGGDLSEGKNYQPVSGGNNHRVLINIMVASIFMKESDQLHPKKYYLIFENTDELPIVVKK